VLVAAIRGAAVDDLAEVEVGLRGLVARFAARTPPPPARRPRRASSTAPTTC
jgi:hypothetical protein